VPKFVASAAAADGQCSIRSLKHVGAQPSAAGQVN